MAARLFHVIYYLHGVRIISGILIIKGWGNRQTLAYQNQIYIRQYNHTHCQHCGTQFKYKFYIIHIYHNLYFKYYYRYNLVTI